MSLFVLWSPVIGILLAGLKWQKVVHVVLFGLIIFSLPWVLFNSSRPLVVPPYRFECEMLPHQKGRCSSTAAVTRKEQSILTADRYMLYFIQAPALAPSFASAVDDVLDHHCDRIGVMKSWNAWEYPLWVLTQQRAATAIQIEHVFVANSSSPLAAREPFRSFQPCALVSISENEVAVEVFEPNLS